MKQSVTMERKTRHKSLTFTLKGINPKQIEDRYGIVIESNLGDIPAPKFTTPIDGLSLNNTDNKLFSYFDESKKTHRCFCTMVNSKHKPLPHKTSIHCFHCRNQFSSSPIGVPLKYVYSQSVKTYFSEITKDTYEIRENISIEKRKELEALNENQKDQHKKTLYDTNITIDKKEYYVTDGIFCSFNCAYAFIQNNEGNPEYNLSKSLLIAMYEKLFGVDFTIFPAPDWRLLTQYGGHLSIDEFREQFNRIEYIDIENRFLNGPVQYNSGKVYEQKIKF